MNPTHQSSKQAVLALEPNAYTQAKWGKNGQRVFYLFAEERILGHGISPREVWANALKILERERK